jgi:anti-sigma28 factor (negative regulator of flagellin synthesis)
MSIRIQNDHASDIASSQASRPDALTGSTSASGNKTGGASNPGGDSVGISSSAQSISATLEQHNAGRAERVSQLASLYASGRYDADPAQVSHAIVSNAISGISGGSGH